MEIRAFFTGLLVIILFAIPADPVDESSPDLVSLDLSLGFSCFSPLGGQLDRVRFEPWSHSKERLVRVESRGQMGRAKKANCDFEAGLYICRWGWGASSELNIAHPQVRSSGPNQKTVSISGQVRLAEGLNHIDVSCRLGLPVTEYN